MFSFGKILSASTYRSYSYVRQHMKVSTPLGTGEVVGHDVLGMNVIVLLENGEKAKFKHTEVKLKGLFG